MKLRMTKTMLITFLVVITSALQTEAQQLILLSRAEENGTYMKFLHRADPTLILKSAYKQPADSIEIWLQQASGIVVTGGEDIHPSRYGKDDEVYKCGKFDLYRDSLELAMIAAARNRSIPMLGICRGEQMLNVALGGTLYTDIPTDIGKKVRHRKRRGTATHEVSIDTLSLLNQVTGVTSGTVNSFHHQCVDRPAESVAIAARSADNVVECIVYRYDDWNALGVQWHPERLDFEDPLAGNIAAWFLSMLE
jgi:putative glutamine amidotransferase